MDSLTISKERILEILKEFPDSVTIDDFIDRLIITAKIEKAREQFENGEYLTEEEFDDEIKKWN